MFYKRRQKFQNFSVKVGIVFSKLGLSPNQWTLITIIPALISFYFLTSENFIYATLFFAIAAFIDLVDGSVARVTGRVTKLGAYLDTIIDRYVEAIILFGLLFVAMPVLIFPYYIWIFIYFFGAMMTTYAKAAAKEKNLVKDEIKGGILERAERLLLLTIGLIVGIFSLTYLLYVIILLGILSNVTAVQRIFIAIKES